MSGNTIGEDDSSSSLTIGHGTEDVLDHTLEQLQNTSWPLREGVPNLAARVQFAPTPNTSEETSTIARTSHEEAPVVGDNQVTHVGE